MKQTNKQKCISTLINCLLYSELHKNPVDSQDAEQDDEDRNSWGKDGRVAPSKFRFAQSTHEQYTIIDAICVECDCGEEEREVDI